MRTPFQIYIAISVIAYGGQTHALAQLKPSDFGLPASASRRSGEPNEQRPDHVHEGVDFSTKGPDGSLLSPDFTAGLGVSGTVIQAGGGNFNTIAVKLDNGTQIEYLHASDVYVHKGQKVGPATRLGRTGNTGVKDIHLHIQAKDKWGHAINPDTAIAGKYVQRIRPQPGKSNAKQPATAKGHSATIIGGDFAGDWVVDSISAVLNQPGVPEQTTNIKGADLIFRTTKIRGQSNGSFAITLGDMITKPAPTTNDIPSPILAKGNIQSITATGKVSGEYGDPKSFTVKVHWASQDRLQIDIREDWSFSKNDFSRVTHAIFHRGR